MGPAAWPALRRTDGVAGALPDDRTSALHRGWGGGRGSRVIHELLGHSVQGERRGRHQAEGHRRRPGPRLPTCQGLAPRARAPSMPTSPEDVTHRTPEACDDRELRATHAATGDQGSCKSAAKRERLPPQEHGTRRDLTRTRKTNASGSACSQRLGPRSPRHPQTGHSPAITVGRQPATSKGQTTAEVTDVTTPQTSTLQQSLWAKISKK